MKKLFSFFCAIVLLSSCSEKFVINDFSLDKEITKRANLPVSEQPISPVLSDVVNPIFNKVVNPDVLLNFQSETAAEQYMNNALTNSKNYLQEAGFTNQEIIEEFGSIDDPRVIYLAVVTKAIIDNPGGLSGKKVLDCALEAFDIKDIVEAIGSKTLTFGTKKALIKAVGKVAARFGLGYISTAIMVGEFIYCMLQEDPVPGDGSGDNGGDSPDPNPNNPNNPNDPNNQPLKFPENNSEYYLFTIDPEYIYSQNKPKYSSDVYYLNGKYYFNSSKTCLLPTGYYFTFQGDNVYHVVNGEIISIINMPAAPCFTCALPIEPNFDNPFNCGPLVPTL